MKNIVELTDAAIKHIQEIIIKNKGMGFRLSVKKAGCSGYQYHPEIIDVPRSNDIEISTIQGVKIYLDPSCVEMINGTVIDCVAKNLGQRQLIFNNPNVDNQCGCGESFNVKSHKTDE